MEIGIVIDIITLFFCSEALSLLFIWWLKWVCTLSLTHKHTHARPSLQLVKKFHGFSSGPKLGLDRESPNPKYWLQPWTIQIWIVPSSSNWWPERIQFHWQVFLFMFYQGHFSFYLDLNFKKHRWTFCNQYFHLPRSFYIIQISILSNKGNLNC